MKAILDFRVLTWLGVCACLAGVLTWAYVLGDGASMSGAAVKPANSSAMEQVAGLDALTGQGIEARTSLGKVQAWLGQVAAVSEEGQELRTKEGATPDDVLLHGLTLVHDRALTSINALEHGADPAAVRTSMLTTITTMRMGLTSGYLLEAGPVPANVNEPGAPVAPTPTMPKVPTASLKGSE